MTTTIRNYLVLLGSGLAVLSAQAQLTVSPSNNANTLVNSILGSGISVVGGSAVFSSPNVDAAGTFSGGGSLIGISSGLLLTTGTAQGAIGPNNVSNFTGFGSISEVASNVTSLKFDFTSAGGDLFFNYVFASEEYNEYVNEGFNDSFQLLLNGVNIAKVPGTGDDVSIDSVNLGSNSTYFNNNIDPAVTNIQYDGFTDVFTAQFLNLSAGEHTIEFRIADVGDNAYDSAVFIQANSFSDTPTPPGVPDAASTLGLFAAALGGLALIRRRR